MLQELDIPWFVAKKLSRIPPVSASHIDVLGELNGLKVQMMDAVEQMGMLNISQVSVVKKIDNLGSKIDHRSSPPCTKQRSKGCANAETVHSQTYNRCGETTPMGNPINRGLE